MVSVWKCAMHIKGRPLANKFSVMEKIHVQVFSSSRRMVQLRAIKGLFFFTQEKHNKMNKRISLFLSLSLSLSLSLLSLRYLTKFFKYQFDNLSSVVTRRNKKIQK